MKGASWTAQAERFDETLATATARSSPRRRFATTTVSSTSDAATGRRPATSHGSRPTAPRSASICRPKCWPSRGTTAVSEGLDNVEFRHADAQIYPFESASFDVVISRMGSMFFGDPIAAFTNLHRALRPDGRLTLLTWQGLTENEWLTEFRAALAVGRDLPTPPPDAPSPFASPTPIACERSSARRASPTSRSRPS